MTSIGAILLYSILATSNRGCLLVENPEVRAGEIASVLPGLLPASAETTIGHVPEPGSVRWWRGEALRRVAARLQLDVITLRDFCVERPTKPYTRDEVLSALRASVPVGVQVDLIDFSALAMPKGHLLFDWRTIEPAVCRLGESGLVWRGRARFAVNRSLPFWANVKLFTEHNRVLAVRDIPPRAALRSEDLRQERSTGPPQCHGVVDTVEAATGMESTRRIPAGATIRATDLRKPYDVMNGDRILVEAISDSSRLQFTATAVSRGYKGEVILVQDATHRRVFRARVTGRKAANVDMEVLVASRQNRPAVERSVGSASPGGLR